MKTLNALATIGLATICYLVCKATMAVCDSIYETKKEKKRS